MSAARCMRRVAQSLGSLLLTLALGLALVPSAQAHLMVAQRGTLNLAGDGGFMVLSLPVSAFKGVDNNGDGLLSPAELQAHEATITQQLQQGAQLLDRGRALPLQGVLLQLSPEDHQTEGAARQIVALGRFALGTQREGLSLRVQLFGSQADEQAQQITVSRGGLTQRLLLAPGREESAVMPSAWALFSDHVGQGMTHVLGGFDHLLFLLVVLASGFGLRQVLLALTCFTLGHAITLAANAFGAVTVPSSIVEPAIAASIVAMALFDRWQQRRVNRGERRWPEAMRLALVFGFALIHGLGLAGALSDLGLDTRHRLWSLAGFNVGVELAQVAVALLAAAAAWALARGHSMRARARVPAGVPFIAPSPRPAGATAWSLRLATWASMAAMAAGTFWFVQRVAGLG